MYNNFNTFFLKPVLQFILAIIVGVFVFIVVFMVISPPSYYLLRLFAPQSSTLCEQGICDLDGRLFVSHDTFRVIDGSYHNIIGDHLDDVAEVGMKQVTSDDRAAKVLGIMVGMAGNWLVTDMEQLDRKCQGGGFYIDTFLFVPYLSQAC